MQILTSKAMMKHDKTSTKNPESFQDSGDRLKAHNIWRGIYSYKTTEPQVTRVEAHRKNTGVFFIYLHYHHTPNTSDTKNAGLFPQ